MSGADTLVVSGSRVLTTASIPTPDTTTPFPGCSNPDNAGGRCTKVEAITEGKGVSTRLKVDGAFVLLESLQATTDRKSPVRIDPGFVNNDFLGAE